MRIRKNTVDNTSVVISAFVIFILTLILMKVYEKQFITYSNGLGILDMRFHYDSFDVYQLFNILGDNGRLIYIKNLVIDFVFISSFAIIQGFVLKKVMGKKLLSSKLSVVVNLAYFRGLLDVLENILLFILLLVYPNRLVPLSTVVGYVTTAKFIILLVWMVAVSILILLRTFKIDNRLKIRVNGKECMK